MATDTVRLSTNALSAVVNCALYEGGLRVRDLDINDPAEMRVHEGRVIWIGLHEPGEELLATLQEEFHLHELAVEDAYKAHQRPKVEIYGETLFLAVKTFQNVGEDFAMGETCIFAGKGYVITVRHGPSRSYTAVRARCESSPNLLRQGEDFILYALLDFIVDNYFPAVDELEERIEELEESLFNPVEDRDALAEISEVRRKLTELRHVVAPLPDMCQRLTRFDVPVLNSHSHPYFRDVYDHCVTLLDRMEQLREGVKSVVETKMLLSSRRQNEVTRRLAAWAAILAVPTAIAGIYGMNFEHMPELTWRYGYLLVVGVIATACSLLFWRFRRAGWI